MIRPASLLLADHGELITAIPFVMPAVLLVGVLLAIRIVERRRHSSDSE